MFDPEKVERFDSEDWGHVRCVKETDYDRLLALYREAVKDSEDMASRYSLRIQPK